MIPRPFGSSAFLVLLSIPTATGLSYRTSWDPLNCHVTSCPLKTSLRWAIDDTGKNAVVINMLYVEIVSGRKKNSVKGPISPK